MADLPILYQASTHKALMTHAISYFKSTQKTSPLTQNTLILPTAGTIYDLRRQMGDTIGVEMVQFYRLARKILDQAAIPIHELNDAAIRRLIRKLLNEMLADGALTTFADVSQKPGFVDLILDWLREMKSQGIFPEEYRAYADESGLERDRQLADLYERYQAFMQKVNTPTLTACSGWLLKR